MMGDTTGLKTPTLFIKYLQYNFRVLWLPGFDWITLVKLILFIWALLQRPFYWMGGGGIFDVFSMCDVVVWLGFFKDFSMDIWKNKSSWLFDLFVPSYSLKVDFHRGSKFVQMTCDLSCRLKGWQTAFFSPLEVWVFLKKVWYDLYICWCPFFFFFEMFLLLTTRVTLISHWTGRRIRMYLVYCASHQFKLCFSLILWDISHLLSSKILSFLFFFFLKTLNCFGVLFCCFLHCIGNLFGSNAFLLVNIKGKCQLFLRVHNHVSPCEKSSHLHPRLLIIFITTYCPVPHSNNKNFKKWLALPFKKRFKCLKCICTKYCW